MKQKIIAGLAVSAVLVLGACSSETTSQPPNPVSAKVSPEGSPTPTENKAKETSKEIDFQKLDIKFDLAGTSESRPYGISYNALHAVSSPEMGVEFSKAEVQEATKIALEGYHELRTEPGLFKDDRTPKRDDKIVQKYDKYFGKLVLNDWAADRDSGKIFNYIPSSAAITLEVYNDESLKDKFDVYYIDTSKTHEIRYANMEVAASTLQETNEPVVVVTLNETIEYNLESSMRGVQVSQLTFYMSKDSGKWKNEGIYWNSPSLTLYDADGNLHPEMKENKAF